MTLINENGIVQIDQLADAMTVQDAYRLASYLIRRGQIYSVKDMVRMMNRAIRDSQDLRDGPITLRRR